MNETAWPVPEPTVSVASYDVSCLPLNHPDRRHFTLRVTRRRFRGKIGFGVTDGIEWYGHGGSVHEQPVLHAEVDAVALACQLAPLMTVNGHTVADALTRTAGESR